jgi:hypothetical protein
LLVACEYDTINVNTKVFNKYALSGSIWVNLPNYVRCCTLVKIIDISNQKYEEVGFDESTVIQYSPRPWIKIDTSILSLVSGMHTYKLIFESKFGNDFSQSVYIAYILQDDNPITPYVYMPDRGNPPKAEEEG